MADGTTKVGKNIVNAAQKSNQSNLRSTLRRYIKNKWYLSLATGIKWEGAITA